MRHNMLQRSPIQYVSMRILTNYGALEGKGNTQLSLYRVARRIHAYPEIHVI